MSARAQAGTELTPWQLHLLQRRAAALPPGQPDPRMANGHSFTCYVRTAHP